MWLCFTAEANCQSVHVDQMHDALSSTPASNENVKSIPVSIKTASKPSVGVDFL